MSFCVMVGGGDATLVEVGVQESKVAAKEMGACSWMAGCVAPIFLAPSSSVILLGYRYEFGHDSWYVDPTRPRPPHPTMSFDEVFDSHR